MPDKGLVHIYTGDGKGKTTAAVGLALRKVGCGERVLFVQFLKPGTSSELDVLSKLGVEVVADYPFHKFVFAMNAAEKENCKESQCRCLEIADKAARGGEYGLIVLDESCPAADIGMIDESILKELISEKAPGTELVLTGRGATGDLIDLADYVSVIQKQKHPFDKGIPARRGIEY